MTEFIVIAVAIVPLLLLIPLIAKYQDIGNATQLASRYVAFEAMTRNDTASTFKPEAELALEVRRRFFSAIDAPIKTGDAAGNFKAHQNLFWRGPRDEALITDLNRDVVVSFGPSRGATHASARTPIDGEDAPFMTLRSIGLEGKGVYTANLSVAIANMPSGLRFHEPFDRIDLRMTRSTSVAIDPWTAQSATDVNERLMRGSLTVFPAPALQAVAGSVAGFVPSVDAPIALRPPQLGQLGFWTDVVPEDRLRPRFQSR